jgi:hypothetical protein
MPILTQAMHTNYVYKQLNNNKQHRLNVLQLKHSVFFHVLGWQEHAVQPFNTWQQLRVVTSALVDPLRRVLSLMIHVNSLMITLRVLVSNKKCFILKLKKVACNLNNNNIIFTKLFFIGIL